MPKASTGIEEADLNASSPNWNKTPAIMPDAMPWGIARMTRSNQPDMPITKVMAAAVIYAPTIWLTLTAGSSVTNSAVPGADQAVTMGVFNHQLRKIPLIPDPMEIA